jgi:hypothetical protein
MHTTNKYLSSTGRPVQVDGNFPALPVYGSISWYWSPGYSFAIVPVP